MPEIEAKPPIEWLKLKSGEMLAHRGEQLLCIVEKVQDLPVDGWTPNMLPETYSSVEAARAAADKIIGEWDEENRPEPSFAEKYLPILKGAVAILEAAPRVERIQSLPKRNLD